MSKKRLEITREGKRPDTVITGIYTGEVKDDVPNGKGSCTWNIDPWHTATYEGDWLNGKMHGKGIYRSSEYSPYMGDEWTYEGDFANGKIEGFGIQTSETAGTYEGEWKNGKKNGFGIRKYAGGTIAKGTWVNDEMNGQGSYYEPNEGYLYEGNFKNGVFDGYGEKKWEDGRYYKGEFKGTRYQGNGILKNEYGIWEGEFEFGHMYGQGSYTSDKGWSFTGVYWEHFRNRGNGKLVFANGDVYEGEVACPCDGMEGIKPDGKGIYTYSDGTVYTGGFSFGRRMDEIKAEKAAEAAAREAKRKKEAEEYRAKKKKMLDEKRNNLTDEDFALRKRLEEKCKVIYGDETDIKKRCEILGRAYFATHNSGYNDHIAWELSKGEETAETEFAKKAKSLKWEIEKLCEYYELEIEE